MSEHITELTVRQLRVSTVEAVLLVELTLADVPDGAHVRGRIHGPRIPGEDTLEDSFDIRDVRREGDHITAKFIVTEPLGWTEQRPFGYEGRVELWRDDARLCERRFAVRFRT